MSPLLALFLFLHVMGAIIVFGPSFAFPLIAGQAQKMPQHGHFAAVVSEVIERRIIIPGAIVQGITGLILIVLLGVNPLTDAPLSVESPLPADFRAVLEGLRAPRVPAPAARPRRRAR